MGTREPTKRDFIYILTGTMAIGGAAAVAWPLIDQMETAADVLAWGSPLTVNLSKITRGQQIVVLWRKNPMFVVHRTPANLVELRKPSAPRPASRPRLRQHAAAALRKELVAVD